MVTYRGPGAEVGLMLNDLRYALRALRQNPGFALTAIISIALGIGATTTVFSLGDGLVLRPLAVPNPSQVMKLTFANVKRDLRRYVVSRLCGLS